MCSGTGNGKTISMFTCAVEQAIARPSVCAHYRQWQDHQSVHTCSGTGNGKTISMFIRAMAQAIARPSVFAHNIHRQDHNSVHMCSGTGNGKTISMFIRAKCLECECVAEIVYSWLRHSDIPAYWLAGDTEPWKPWQGEINFIKSQAIARLTAHDTFYIRRKLRKKKKKEKKKNLDEPKRHIYYKDRIPGVGEASKGCILVSRI